MARRTYFSNDYKSAREWHLYHVYTDPEFVGEYEALRDYFESKQNTTKAIPKDAQQRIKALAERYAITVDDLNYYHLEYDAQGYAITDLPYSINYDEVANRIEVRFDPRMKQSDFDNVVWHEIEALKTKRLGISKATKRKPPVAHRLIYAIFKAQQRGKSFPAIYELYDNGVLPYFVQPLKQQGPYVKRQFTGVKSLEKHYNEHKPTSTPL